MTAAAMSHDKGGGLLPCPFCGGAARIERVGNRRHSTQYACNECGCTLETGEEWNHGADWNRRPAIDLAATRDAREGVEASDIAAIEAPRGEESIPANLSRAEAALLVRQAPTPRANITITPAQRAEIEAAVMMMSATTLGGQRDGQRKLVFALRAANLIGGTNG